MSSTYVPFSQRHGYTGQEITVWGDAPQGLRSWVLETARSMGWSSLKVRQIVCRTLLKIPDRLNRGDFKIWDEVHWLLKECAWFKIYDIIEALHAWFFQEAGRDCADHFTDTINSFLLEKGIGWQLVNGKIVTRGDEAFEGTVETAVAALEQNAKPTAAGHLRSGIAALSARPKPDTSGAVAHATSAVECVLGEITGQALPLGKYLDKYPGLFHPALKKGLDGIYGYACDEGARHGKEGTEPAREEAEFALAVCAAICTLLTRKHPDGK